MRITSAVAGFCGCAVAFVVVPWLLRLCRGTCGLPYLSDITPWIQKKHKSVQEIDSKELKLGTTEKMLYVSFGPGSYEIPFFSSHYLIQPIKLMRVFLFLGMTRRKK